MQYLVAPVIVAIVTRRRRRLVSRALFLGTATTVTSLPRNDVIGMLQMLQLLLPSPTQSELRSQTLAGCVEFGDSLVRATDSTELFCVEDGSVFPSMVVQRGLPLAQDSTASSRPWEGWDRKLWRQSLVSGFQQQRRGCNPDID